MIIESFEMHNSVKTYDELVVAVNSGDFDFILDKHSFIYITIDSGAVRVNKDRTITKNVLIDFGVDKVYDKTSTNPPSGEAIEAQLLKERYISDNKYMSSSYIDIFGSALYTSNAISGSAISDLKLRGKMFSHKNEVGDVSPSNLQRFRFAGSRYPEDTEDSVYIRTYYGNNLFDSSSIYSLYRFAALDNLALASYTELGDWIQEVTFDGKDCIKVTQLGMFSHLVLFHAGKPNTQYTLSVDVYVDDNNPYLTIHCADSVSTQFVSATKTKQWEHMSITSNPGSTLDTIKFSYGDSLYCTVYIDKKSLMLCEGADNLSYEDPIVQVSKHSLNEPLYALSDSLYNEATLGGIYKRVNYMELPNNFSYLDSPWEGYSQFFTAALDGVSNQKDETIAIRRGSEFLCTHMMQATPSSQQAYDIWAVVAGGGNGCFRICVKNSFLSIMDEDTSQQKQDKLNNWIVSQSQAGTPVMLLYQLNTPYLLEPDYMWPNINLESGETLSTNTYWSNMSGTYQSGMDNFVEFTDYATKNKTGAVQIGSGIYVSTRGVIAIDKASESAIDVKVNNYNPIVPSNLSYAVKSVNDLKYVKAPTETVDITGNSITINNASSETLLTIVANKSTSVSVQSLIPLTLDEVSTVNNGVSFVSVENSSFKLTGTPEGAAEFSIMSSSVQLKPNSTYLFSGVPSGVSSIFIEFEIYDGKNSQTYGISGDDPSIGFQTTTASTFKITSVSVDDNSGELDTTISPKLLLQEDFDTIANIVNNVDSTNGCTISTSEPNSVKVTYTKDIETGKTEELVTSIAGNDLVLKDNTETQLTDIDVTALNVSITDKIPRNFSSLFSFRSGSTATTFTSINSIKYKGDDCTNTGVFTPLANTTYEVAVKCIGYDSTGNPIIVARVSAM